MDRFCLLFFFLCSQKTFFWNVKKKTSNEINSSQFFEMLQIKGYELGGGKFFSRKKAQHLVSFLIDFCFFFGCRNRDNRGRKPTGFKKKQMESIDLEMNILKTLQTQSHRSSKSMRGESSKETGFFSNFQFYWRSKFNE